MSGDRYSEPQVHSVDCCLLDPFNRGAPGIASGLARLALRAESSKDCSNERDLSEWQHQPVEESEAPFANYEGSCCDIEHTEHNSEAPMCDEDFQFQGFSKAEVPQYQPHDEVPVYQPHDEVPVCQPHDDVPVYQPHDDVPQYQPHDDDVPQYQPHEQSSLYGAVPVYRGAEASKSYDFSEPPRYRTHCRSARSHTVRT